MNIFTEATLKLKLIVIIILTQATLFGQTKENHNKPRDLTLSIKIFPTATSNIAWFGSNEIYADFQKRITVSGGFELTKKIKENWSFETGLILYDWGFKEIGMSLGDSEWHKYNEQYLFLTVPVKGVYKYRRFFLGLGLNVSYLVRNNQIRDNVLTKFNHVSTGLETKFIDNMLFGLNTKVGFDFYLTERLNFCAELSGIAGIKNGGLYSFGLGVGFGYKI